MYYGHSSHCLDPCGDRRAAAKSGPLTVSPLRPAEGAEEHPHRKRAPWDHAGLQGARHFSVLAVPISEGDGRQFFPWLRAANRVFSMSMARVMGPTPPGTGVM